jgi:hypothetical protein
MKTKSFYEMKYDLRVNQAIHNKDYTWLPTNHNKDYTQVTHYP